MSTKPKFTTRAALPSDIPTILHFILELAIYEKEEDKATATPEDMHLALFGEGEAQTGKVAWAIIAELDEAEAEAELKSANGKTPIGFALYFYNFSTWIGRKGLYLEDLYVSPKHRNLGAGRALFAHLARVALDNNCGRMDWSVLKWNAPSIGFYQESLGATRQEEWVGMRLEGNAEIQRLLESR